MRLFACVASLVTILAVFTGVDPACSADRILVMENYRISASFAAGQCDETALGLAMSGARQQQEALNEP